MDFFHDVYADADSNKEESEYTSEEVMAAVDNISSEAETLFEEKNYDEALSLLLDLYEILKARKFFLLIQSEVGYEGYLNLFTWTCFRICFCYMEQKDYPRAFFYIDQVRGRDADCFIEWINVYVNSERIDALGIVEYYVNNPSKVQELFQEEADFKKIMDFLERRLGYLYIEAEQYEDAREIFTRLLENPASSEFAREELEYLERILNNKE